MLRSLLHKLYYYDLIYFLSIRLGYFAKYYAILSLHRRAKEKSLVVYSMGKVGATTIAFSLADPQEDYSIYQIKWLNKHNLDLDRKFNAFFHHKNKKEGIISDLLPNYLVHGYYARHRLARLRKRGSPITICSLTRDPVARNISSFFQNLRKYYRYDIHAKRDEIGLDAVVKELSALFVYRYIDKNGISFLDSNPLTWFDEELRSEIGIDVYDEDFWHHKGFTIYEKGNTKLLILRLEDLETCFEEASEQFFGRRVKLKKQQNMTNQEYYAQVYQKFKEEVKIPEYYLDAMYHSRYAMHFYTEPERLNFRARWEKNSIATVQ